MPPKPRNRDRAAVYFLSIGLFIAGALLALLVTRGYAFDFDSLTLQKRGVIVLHSDPKAADVTLDGKRLKKRTNARLSLAPETYRLAVESPGRIPWQREVRLDPGEAVIEEITLFPLAPRRADLTKRAVGRFAVSPDGKRIVTTETQGAGRLLRSLDDSGKQRFALPLSTGPRGLATDNEGFILVESAGRLVVYAPDGKRTADLLGAAGRLTGGSIVFQRGKQVIEAGRTGQNARVLATSPPAWTATDREVYVLGRDGTVTVTTPGGNPKPVAGAGSVATLTTIGDGAVQTTGRDGSFGIIRGDSFETVGPGPVVASVSPDGTFVGYRTNREVRLLDLQTGKDRLVTSLTDPPGRVIPLPGGYYLLYLRGQELHAIARDGSNDRVVTRRVGSTPVVLALDRILATDSRTKRLVRINLKD